MLDEKGRKIILNFRKDEITKTEIFLNKLKVLIYLIISKIFGFTFIIKIMEREGKYKNPLKASFYITVLFLIFPFFIFVSPYIALGVTILKFRVSGGYNG